MKIADAIITVLRDLDTRYIFGVSGANIEHIHDSVYRLGQGRLTSVMTKSEFGAAFMADARARTHRTLGVCCATSGGGMMNLAVGVSESYAQEVPVLALVGQPPLAQEGRGGFQDTSGKANTLDGFSFWKSISKWVAKIDSASLFWSQFAKALTLPFEGRQGPTILMLPRDMMEVEVGDIPSWFPTSLMPPSSSTFRPESLDGIYEAIAQAQNPVMILGAGVSRHAAEELAHKVASITNIAVASTLACSGVFPNDCKNYLGMVGVAGHPSAHQYITDKADLVIAVGTKLCAMTRGPLDKALSKVNLWLVNSDNDDVDPHLHPQEMLELNSKDFFEGLLERLEHQPISPKHSAKPEVTCFVPQKIEYSHKPADALNGSSTGLRQSEAIRVLGDYLPQSGHLLFDAGNCAAAAAHYMKIPYGVSTTIALGMGGMGYAIAGAIGAQIGEPDTERTTVICGDGAFMMTGLEIHTAVDYQLPILWVVFNNNMHGMCVTRQHLMFEGRFEGNVYSDVNIARIASGFGDESRIWVGCAKQLSDLPRLLDEYQTHHSHKPGVLEIKIAQEEMPPFTPFLETDSPHQRAWEA